MPLLGLAGPPNSSGWRIRRMFCDRNGNVPPMCWVDSERIGIEDIGRDPFI